MTLHEFLIEAGQSHAAFAKMVGCHPVTVTKWVTGRMFPRVGALARIERATQGKVRANDFCLPLPEATAGAAAAASESIAA